MVHRSRRLVLLIVLAAWTPAPLLAQQLTDDQLIRKGKAAYDSNDYINALPLLFAYEQRDPPAIQTDAQYAQQVKAARQFASARLQDVARQLKNLEAENQALKDQLGGNVGSSVSGITKQPPTLSVPPAGTTQERLLQTSGSISLLRVQDVGTKYGPPQDRIDVEVIMQLANRPGKSFGFQLRRDQNEAARRGMLDVLLKAYEHNWPVTIDYRIAPNKNNGTIIRVWIRR